MDGLDIDVKTVKHMFFFYLFINHINSGKKVTKSLLKCILYQFVTNAIQTNNENDVKLKTKIKYIHKNYSTK